MQQISATGLTLIKTWEALRLQVYYDVGGLPTIGWGHLLTRSELSSGKIHIGGCYKDWRNGLTNELAEQLLAQDVEEAETGIRRCTPPEVLESLTQNQYDALVSFVFNVGAGAYCGSTLRKRLLAGELSDVPHQLTRWVYAGGQRIRGLQNRRAHEIDLWRKV